MPTYDYVCKTCGQTFEVFHSIKDDPLTDCLDDACAGTLKRKIGTGAGIIFKGSGFYETDYRSESYKKAAKAESESAGKSNTSTSSSSSSGGEKKAGSGESSSSASSTTAGSSSASNGSSSQSSSSSSSS